MKIKKTIIERIVIIGKMEEWDNASDYCKEYGYQVIRSGAKRKNALEVDTSQFKFIAEKEI